VVEEEQNRIHKEIEIDNACSFKKGCIKGPTRMPHRKTQTELLPNEEKQSRLVIHEERRNQGGFEL